MVIRRQKAAQAQKAHAANDNLPTTTPPPPAAPTARLVKGECIATMGAMTAESVDLVITSPPYMNIGMEYGDAFDTIEDYIEFSRQWITAAARALKPGGAMWINVGMHKAGPNSRVPLTYYLFPLIAGTGLTFVQEIVWDRRAQQNTTQRFSTRSERWVYLVKPGVLKGGRGRPKHIAPTFNLDDVRRPSTSADKRNNPAGANPADIWEFTQVHGTSKERTAHPCPFPQAMIERIVLACSNPGDVVLDPFGGSGTTGAAAMANGRSSVMIEREPIYWSIIEKRLGLVDRVVVGSTEAGAELFADFHHGDAIEKMKLIPSKSVNLILCDPPFGTINCSWDQLLPAGDMWREYERILAPDGMVVLHAAQPFTTDLIMSNRPWFSQHLIWEKTRPVGFLHAKRRHMAAHEDVLVFKSPRGKTTFNPQGVVKKDAKTTRRGKVGEVYRDTYTKDEWVNDSSGYPRSVLKFASERTHGHPTQKPQTLAEYLIRTYSNPGDVVLDHCYGSGTTGAAAMVTGRSFIGVERDDSWFAKGRARILAAAGGAELPSPTTPVAANDVQRVENVQPDIEQAPARSEPAKNATIINADVMTEMKKMADGSVDIIVTSPPYNLGQSSGGGFGGSGGSGKWKAAKLRDGYEGHDDAMPYADYVAWQKAFLRECWRLIPEAGAIFYQHKNRVQKGVLRTPHDLNPDLPLRQIIIWDRGSGMNFNEVFATPSHEVIYLFAKPKFRFRKGHGLKDVLKILPDRGNPHPAPFPVELPRMIIAATNAKTILDPFCGSGSTGVAALMEGRKFVGIEQSADYCRMAEDRLEAMHSEGREKVGSGDVANDNADSSDALCLVKPIASEGANDDAPLGDVIRYGTVCSGIEGVSLAWEPLGGFKPAFFSEIESFPSAVLNHHWPAVPNLGNMLDIDGADWRGKLDVLWGSSPCQSFSRTGKRLGMADARGELTRKFVDLADEIDPEFIILENVKGLLSDKNNAFGCYLGALVGAPDPLLCREKRWPNFGYVTGVRRHVAWRVLDAQHGGVAQHRERVFVVGCPRNGPDPREVLFEQASEGRHPETAAGKARDREALVAARLGDRHPAIYLNADATPKWAVEQSYTLRAAGGSGGKACVVVDGKVREIIPEEREGLMGIPVGHTNIPWPGKARSLDVARYKAIGNSLAIPDVRWLGERIKLARAIHRAGINLPLAA